jgi:nitronate monooxygenase
LSDECARIGTNSLAKLIMGVLPRHNARGREEFESWLGAIRSDLDAFARRNPDAKVGPLAVNIIARQSVGDTRADLEVCARYGVEVIISALGNPAELSRIVHDWGGRMFHDVTSLRFAAKAVEGGVDGLTCIGSGGGGHSGALNALVFIPRVREMWDGTILLAGSVATGAAIRAAELVEAYLERVAILECTNQVSSHLTTSSISPLCQASKQKCGVD